MTTPCHNNNAIQQWQLQLQFTMNTDRLAKKIAKKKKKDFWKFVCYCYFFSPMKIHRITTVSNKATKQRVLLRYAWTLTTVWLFSSSRSCLLSATQIAQDLLSGWSVQSSFQSAEIIFVSHSHFFFQSIQSKRNTEIVHRQLVLFSLRNCSNLQGTGLVDKSSHFSPYSGPWLHL